MTDYSDARVLIVDDDAFMVNFTRRILGQLGIDDAGEASDGAGALELLASETVDILFCDLNMPGMDGVELLRHLADLDARPSLVLISGEDKRVLRTAEQLASAHDLNVLGSIEKPPKKEGIQPLLDAWASQRAAALAKPAVRRSGPALSPDEIRAGIRNDQVVVYYQPKVSTTTREIEGLECLARWRDPERGLLGPGSFIPIAEEEGLIPDLTRAVFRRAIAQVGDWLTNGLDLKISVNVSVEDLSDLDLLTFVTETTAAEGVDPHKVILEVTESRIMADIATPLEILTRLRLKGIGLAIDDYGTGFSSMQQLKRIPFTELKIDRAFVAGAHEDAEARAMLESGVSLAKRLELTTVAEGVETQEEWDLVASLGVDLVQGYFVAKPMPADEFEGWAQEWRRTTEQAS